MALNVDRYQRELDDLIGKGQHLHWAMVYAESPEEFKRALKQEPSDEAERIFQTLPSFTTEYQHWYSEAKALVRQLLPDRSLADFTRHYEKPKSRKEITVENYTIEDYFQGFSVTFGQSTIVKPEEAIPRFLQQLSIVASIKRRFQSSLFDVRQLAQADLFDSELDAAKELATNKFNRAAGTVAGAIDSLRAKAGTSRKFV